MLSLPFSVRIKFCILIEIRDVVEGQNCKVDADCCVNRDAKDCVLQCVTQFRQFRSNFTKTQKKMRVETFVTNKTPGKCFPKGKIN